MRKFVRIGTAVVAALAAAAAIAGAPNKINLQGVLRTDTGALQDGSFTFQVQIFPDAVTSTPILDETFNNVAVASGVFSIEIGGSTPGLGALLAAAPEAHVQFTVNGTAMPKQPMNSSAYTLHAATVPATGIQNWPAQCSANEFVRGMDAGMTAAVCARALVPGDVAGSGVAQTVSRSDHNHPVSCGWRNTTQNAGSSIVGCQGGEVMVSGGCVPGTTGVAVTQSNPSQFLCGGIFFPPCCDGTTARCPAVVWTCAVASGTVSAYAMCCTSPVQ